MRALIAGNWKMNGTAAALGEIARLAESVAARPPAADILICPPATLLNRAVAAAAGRIAIGGQDCHAQASGAYTGDISAEMLKDAGASAVIVGHSERRHYHGESDALVAAKAAAAHRAGLLAIVCVGESEAERDAGRALEVVAAQLAGSMPADAKASQTAIAYEPIWAIGTGRTPALGDILDMHAHIRAEMLARTSAEGARMRILYGGSVKPSNAADILGLAEVGGALVGGASLEAMEFSSIFSSVSSKE